MRRRHPRTSCRRCKLTLDRSYRLGIKKILWEGFGQCFLSSLVAGLLVNELPVTNEAQPTTRPSRLRRLLSTVKRWLREPLLHFLLIGLLLFSVYTFLNRGRGGAESPREIVLSLDELATMAAYFESQWHRRPTP